MAADRGGARFAGLKPAPRQSKAMKSGDGRPPSDDDSGAATGHDEGGDRPPDATDRAPDGDYSPESTGGPVDGDGADGGDESGATVRPPSGGRGRAAGVGDRPSPRRETGQEGVLSRLRSAEDGPYRILREILVNVAAVVLVGLLLFAVSGVWPPMVAVESGSMEPHMHKGDLVFVTEPGRFVPETADSRGVVTYGTAQEMGYRSFGSFGSVVVYDNPTRPGPPIIHRAHFWVEEGENWYPRADPAAMTADSCAETSFCPAPHAGYVTKGDNNEHYDQANGISGPVKPSWVTGVAQVRIPFLGWIRLALSTLTVPGPTPVAAAPVGGTAATWTGPVGGTAATWTGPVGGTATGTAMAAAQSPVVAEGEPADWDVAAATTSPGASPVASPTTQPAADAAARANATRAGTTGEARG
jgi:signal peptidase